MDFTAIIDFFIHCFQVVIHIDQYLSIWSVTLGPWLYVLVFVIIFAETGLVVTPFLPGDSLLFALGAMTTLDAGALNFEMLSGILLVAAFTGDNTNYFFGKFIGPKVFSNEHSKFLNRKHLNKTQKFYNEYGSRAVIIARFMPIIRTFVPFVAGIGQMIYRKYISYSIFGAVLWTQLFLWAGRLFGNLPQVKSNFHIVIFAVIGLSFLPLIIGWLRSRKPRPQ
jgi:membrane-associated protein